MTFRTTISSKGCPKAFLNRGFKSMFSTSWKEPKTTPPVDTEQDRKKTTTK
ncbi:hypothetical protein [Pseudodesulfovibrio piezophilus]|uniref:hypothetical protein n=1 Tax=Pseudodesulfovibrio piezophilus TaxID=879567 RepID=UPI0012FF450A|nr:hypothetical protein [Pseudodesulfovibrio piezophilus]